MPSAKKGRRRFRILAAPIILAPFLLGRPAHSAGGKLEGNDRDHGMKMLEVVMDDIKKNHYDPGIGGGMLDSRFEGASQKIKTAETYDQLFTAIADAVWELGDSHTFFVPPARAVRIEHGWTAKMIGDRCLVTAVKPGSDAEKKGLRPGDLVLFIDGVVPDRKSLLRLMYIYHVVTPRTGMRLQVQTGDNPPRIVDAYAEVHRTEAVADPYITDLFGTIRESEGEGNDRDAQVGGSVMAWRMSSLDMEDKHIDNQIKQARKASALVLDLRGSPGGDFDSKTFLRLVGSLFDHDVTIGEHKLRNGSQTQVAKSRKKDAFTGKLVAVIDSETASTAEVLARLIQLEKRGAVIGDRSAGAAMLSRMFEHQVGSDPVWEYSANVAVGHLLMSDGLPLEGTGVTPDTLLTPTPEDLAAGRDPVLAKALELAGVPTTPEDAGKLFPVDWEGRDARTAERAGQRLPQRQQGSSRDPSAGRQ